MAESGSLENCCPGNGTVGSIPTLSANFQEVVPPGPSHPGPVPPPRSLAHCLDIRAPQRKKFYFDPIIRVPLRATQAESKRANAKK